MVPTVDAFEGSKVVLVDGSRLDPDAAILATGYVRGLEPLVGHLGLLDDRGKPVVIGEKPAAEGLRFLGYTDPTVVYRLLREAVPADGQADRQGTVSRLDTPTQAPGRE